MTIREQLPEVHGNGRVRLPDGRRGTLPPDALAWMRRFDAGEQVEPMEFDIEWEEVPESQAAYDAEQRAKGWPGVKHTADSALREAQLWAGIAKRSGQPEARAQADALFKEYRRVGQ